MGKKIIIPLGYPYSGKQLVEVISPLQLRNRVCELGKHISKHYQSSTPIIIGVLNGAFIFMADLVRYLNIQFEVDFIKIDVQSYEYEVLKGARKTLELNSPILCIEEDNVKNSKAIKFLESLNYEIVDVIVKEHIFKKK